MRLDRFITLNLARPLRSGLGRFRAPGSSVVTEGLAVPVLMYHSISDDPELGVPAYYRTNTSPAVFEQQMQFLADHGYRTISLRELVSSMARPEAARRISGQWPLGDGSEMASNFQASTPNRHPVCLTFDDGFRNFYTEAFPILQRHGFSATVFLSTAFISDHSLPFRPSGSQAKTFPHCLTWSEVRELHRAGFEFGSHTVTHPKLVELDWFAIRSEIADSKSAIEAHLGATIATFCYPYAFPQGAADFIRRLAGLLAEIGYTCSSTTELGRVRRGDDPFRLKRLPINSLDDSALFAAKLCGAYDWLGNVQSLSKTLRHGRKVPGLSPNLQKRNVGIGST